MARTSSTSSLCGATAGCRRAHGLGAVDGKPFTREWRGRGARGRACRRSSTCSPSNPATPIVSVCACSAASTRFLQRSPRQRGTCQVVTAGGNGLCLNIALGYSGRDELVDAMRGLDPLARRERSSSRRDGGASRCGRDRPPSLHGRPLRPRPDHPHERRDAAERLPAVAEQSQRVLLQRCLLARLPRARLPPRDSHLSGPSNAVSDAEQMGRTRAHPRRAVTRHRRVLRAEERDSPSREHTGDAVPRRRSGSVTPGRAPARRRRRGAAFRLRA